MTFRDPARVTCPRCEDPALSPRRALHVEHLSCAACGGLWFERSAFAELAAHIDLPFEEPLGEPVVSALAAPPCPRCRTALSRRQLADGLFIDVCVEHGIWFDIDELTPTLDRLAELADRDRSAWARHDPPLWVRVVKFLGAVLDNGPLSAKPGQGRPRGPGGDRSA